MPDLSVGALLVSTLWLAAIDLAAWNLGSLVCGRWPALAVGSRLERSSVALVLGLTLLGSATFFLALSGLLYRTPLVLAITALALHALYRIVRALRSERSLSISGGLPDPFSAVAFGYLACFLPVCLIPSIP